MMTKLTTPHHTITVCGLEYDCDAMGNVSLSGFDCLIVNDCLILTYEELADLSGSMASEVWRALELAAKEAWIDWQREAASLRAWFRDRR